MIVSAHQSQFIPWLPYFRKVALSDTFVWMDNVQFHRRGFQNRTLVASPQGEKWLSVSVIKGKQQDLINEKKTFDINWPTEQINQISQHYSQAPFFEQTMALLLPIYQKFEQKKQLNLDDINWTFFKLLLNTFEIDSTIIRLSDLNLTTAKSDLILDICSQLKATSYLTGTGAKDYLQVEDFQQKNITINYLSSKPPIYKINASPFIAGLSVLDMMMYQPLEQIINEIHHD